MKYDIVEFKIQCATLDALIEKHCIDESGKSEPIFDGVTDIDIYYNEKIKILWILKEPYDGEDCSGGGWKLFSDINQNLIEIGKNRTFQPIIYTTYGILNNFKQYEDMDYIRDDPQMTMILKRIAYINIKKLPGFRRTPWSTLSKAYKENREILFKQIDLYNPNIIIGGNTLGYFFNDMDLTVFKKSMGDGIDIYCSDERIYINAYHPVQTQLTRDKYVNGIINAVKAWWESRKKSNESVEKYHCADGDSR